MEQTRQDLKTDVLIVGGGLAGCWAAIRARQLGADVILVDKGPVGKTGQSKFSSGDIKCFMAGDVLTEWIDEIFVGGDHIGDRRWIEFVLRETYPRVLDMDAMGVAFEKHDNEFKRELGRGNTTQQVVFNSAQMMLAMRQAAEKTGVKILDNLFVTNLLVEDGKTRGALAINKRSGDLFCFASKTIIMAAGGCAFRHAYFGNQFSTGDAYGLAYEVGAELMNFEFAGYNSCAKAFPSTGMSRLVAYGGVFRNGLGQPFMEKYDPLNKDRAQLTNLAIGMAMEVRAGRGPIYFDLTGMPADKLDLSRKLIPWNFMLLEKAGIDVRTQPMEWIPAFLGVGATSSGIKTDFQHKSTIDGLYACGDAWASTLNGAGMGFGGLNLALCCVSGYRAGQNAAEWARAVEPAPAPAKLVEEKLRDIGHPLEKGTGRQPAGLILKLQQVLIPYEVLILRHGTRLASALEQVRLLNDEASGLSPKDPHELVKLFELKNMIMVAEMILNCAISRTESRGLHYRDDYPARDDESWLNWVVLSKKGDGMKLWTESIPHEALGSLHAQIAG
ncbi:MAG: FAD-binding protein [Dehalococcoidia bacterium]|nr:FAD-binding protein [Dehalococcoidia bacterium]